MEVKHYTQHNTSLLSVIYYILQLHSINQMSTLCFTLSDIKHVPECIAVLVLGEPVHTGLCIKGIKNTHITHMIVLATCTQHTPPHTTYYLLSQQLHVHWLSYTCYLHTFGYIHNITCCYVNTLPSIQLLYKHATIIGKAY